MTSYSHIEEFLGKRRLALVGVSRSEKDYSRAVFREFVKRGYDAIPVNPSTAEIEGRTCVARLQDIQPITEAALIMTPASSYEGMVRDCVENGIRMIWLLHKPRGGKQTASLLSFCKVRNVEVISGQCPLMFLSDIEFIHRLHAGILKFFGKYPK